MFFIWGWTTRLKTLEEGVFYSPATGRDGPYRLVRARRWFTFFFIPLIPLKVVGTFVQCKRTQSFYDPRVLQRPTVAMLDEQLTAAVREIVVAVARADGDISTAERRLAIDIIDDYIKFYSDEDFERDLGWAVTGGLDDRLAFFADALSGQGKETLLTVAARMMTANGTVDDRARELVQSIGERLSMSPAHVRGVIETAASIQQ